MAHGSYDPETFVLEGKTYTVNKQYDLPTYKTLEKYQTKPAEDFDEIMARVYGDGGEVNSYRLLEANAAAFIENQLVGPHVLRIPAP